VGGCACRALARAGADGATARTFFVSLVPITEGMMKDGSQLPAKPIFV
tara:strand:+ start:869 stop:1012 length:144 start_codon:yes stop_codon:yes gene_type:complete